MKIDEFRTFLLNQIVSHIGLSGDFSSTFIYVPPHFSISSPKIELFPPFRPILLFPFHIHQSTRQSARQTRRRKYKSKQQSEDSLTANNTTDGGDVVDCQWYNPEDYRAIGCSSRNRINRSGQDHRRPYPMR